MNRLKQTIIKYSELIPKKIFKRNITLPNTKLAKAITIIGPRRAGKSYLLYNESKKKENVVFINFEDHSLINLKYEELIQISEIAKEITDSEKNCYMFDEIQAIDNWEKLVISLLNEGNEVYITGSNSKLLSKEIATNLRGKALSCLALPLSFKEFLIFKNIKLEKNIEYKNNHKEIKKQFTEYFKFGGYPEIALTDEKEIKNKIINNYYETIIYKDIEERLKIKNSKLIEITINYLLNTFSNTFSITKYQKFLKSNKIPHSLEDIYNIIKATRDIFFIQLVKEHKKSYKKSEISKTKVYLFDTGFIHYIAKENNDKGRILENLIFIELFRIQNTIENKNIFYHQGKFECDFVITQNSEIVEAIQVCYEITDSNQEREYAGLLEVMNEQGLGQGTIITLEQEKTVNIDGKTIEIKPAWKWMLKL